LQKNELRFDALIQAQEAILEHRLGMNEVKPTTNGDKVLKPLGRKPWSQVAAKFESDKRAEYWAEKNKQTEEIDKKIIGVEKVVVAKEIKP